MTEGPTESHDVGSVAEEAAKLFEALQDWAKDGGAGASAAAGAMVSNLGERLHGVNEHLATGGADCTYCPVCQVIAKVRSTSPEVRAHLSVAASSLLQAAAGLLATQVPDRSPDPARVQRIDLDDESPGGRGSPVTEVP